MKSVEERKALGVPAKPLDPEQTRRAGEAPPEAARRGKEQFLLDLLSNRVSPGVDPAAEVKAAFLAEIVKGTKKSPLIDKKKAIELLGTMGGGYNVPPLVAALKAKALADDAAKALSGLTYVYDALRRGRRARQGEERRREEGPRVLGQRGVVHLPPGRPRDDQGQGLQGRRRDQHRRLLARRRRLHPPGHPAPRPGDGQDAVPGRPAEDRRVPRAGLPGRLRRRRRRHRLLPQVGLQQRAVAHRRRHPLRPEQEARRRDHRRRHRPDLLRDRAGLGRAPAQGGRVEAEDRRRGRGRHREGRDPERGGRGALHLQDRAEHARRRVPRRRPHPAHHRPRPHREGAEADEEGAEGSLREGREPRRRSRARATPSRRRWSGRPAASRASCPAATTSRR